MPRTDDDTWDLVSSVGATASVVAAQRAVATRAKSPLIVDPFAEPLVAALGVDYFTRYARGEFNIAESADAPFDLRVLNDSMAIRTRYFDDFFVAATNDGIRQAVILASGLDSRAYRLPWPAGTTVYELDQPQVIDFKTRTIAGLGHSAPVEHRPLGVDLRQDWPTALRDAGFDATRPTAWIAEGLLIYLPPHAQDLLFDRICQMSAPGSRVGTEDVAGIDADQLAEMSARTRAMQNQWLDTGPDVDVAELFYSGERAQASEYLRQNDWTTEKFRTSELFAAHGLDLPDTALTPFGDPVYVTARLAVESGSNYPAH
ncbi:class I SAM-dependent methyltransferase [soil metagenome]